MKTLRSLLRCAAGSGMFSPTPLRFIAVSRVFTPPTPRLGAMGRKIITAPAAVAAAAQVAGFVKATAGPDSTVYLLRYSSSTADSARRLDGWVKERVRRLDFAGLGAGLAFVTESVEGLG